jgi:sugar phosphate isomerase/epimerase
VLHWLTKLLDGMRKEITPYVFVNEFAVRIFHRRPSRNDRAVRALRVVLNVGAGDKPARIAVGWPGFVHVHNRADLIQAQQSVEYFDAINSEWVGWNFDIGNAGRVGPAERWIQVIGKRILRIHVKDYSAKPADPAAGGNARPKLLEGDTNWPAVMKALDNAGYTGWAISEQPGNQAADVETARDLAQRMDRIFAL